MIAPKYPVQWPPLQPLELGATESVNVLRHLTRSKMLHSNRMLRRQKHEIHTLMRASIGRNLLDSARGAFPDMPVQKIRNQPIAPMVLRRQRTKTTPHTLPITAQCIAWISHSQENCLLFFGDAAAAAKHHCRLTASMLIPTGS